MHFSVNATLRIHTLLPFIRNIFFCFYVVGHVYIDKMLIKMHYDNAERKQKENLLVSICSEFGTEI